MTTSKGVDPLGSILTNNFKAHRYAGIVNLVIQEKAMRFDEISTLKLVNYSTNYSSLPCYYRELQSESEKQKPLATMPLLPTLPQLQLHISITQTIIYSNGSDQNNTVSKLFDKIRLAAPVLLYLPKLPGLFHWLLSLFHW